MHPVPNLRDLGGTPTLDGGRVRHGVLLRSAVPEAGDDAPEGIGWPPARVVDLRSAAEIGAGHPMAGSGVDVHHVPLLEALSPEHQAGDPETVRRMREGGLAALYVGMLSLAGDRVAEAVALVADADGPVLVHCAAGKDRTGVVVALALRAVGVGRDEVVADYLRTAEEMAAVTARLQRQPQLDPRRAAPPSYLAIPPDAIEAALEVWDAHPGGPVGWLREASGDTALPDRLAERLRS